MKQGSARRGTVRIALVATAAASFLVSGAACSRGQDDSVYCVDENRRVVDDRYCDDDHYGGSSHSYYYWHRSGRHRYSRGSLVSGGRLISPSDAAGRASIGLPRTGHVSSGVISRGGFGGSHSGTHSGSHTGSHSSGS